MSVSNNQLELWRKELGDVQFERQLSLGMFDVPDDVGSVIEATLAEATNVPIDYY